MNEDHPFSFLNQLPKTMTNKHPAKKPRGITFLKDRNRWQTRITFSGVKYFLGTFLNQEEAAAAYAHAKAIGSAQTRAWVNRDFTHRGSLVDAPNPESGFVEIENRLKKFSFLLDGNRDY